MTNPSAWAQSLSIGAASRGGVVLLTSSTKLTSVTASALSSNARSIDTVNVFGGRGTVSAAVQGKIRSAMSIRTAAPIADPVDPGASPGPVPGM